MANIDLAVGQINITSNFLVARARKVSTPLVTEAQESYASPLASSFNVVLPASGSIDPVNYFVDFYESSDGSSLDLLLATFVVNAKNNLIIEETRYYKVDGGGANDPAPDQDTLTDPYLDGKTIARVFKDGVGRPLAPEDYLFKEWELVTGGGIKLLNGILFSAGEIIAIVISYLGEQTSTTGTGLYNGVATITTNTTLDSTYRNKRIRCVGASSRLVITLEDLSTVPEGAFYHFTHLDGNQLQTKIVPVGGQSILLNGTYTEMSIGPGEVLRIEKVSSAWEVVLPAEGVLHVGDRMAAGYNAHPNTKPEDGTLYDGDDYPRIWYWLSNSLPSTHKVTDDLVVNGGYTHPSGKEGQFVVHSTLKKFRVPNTQNWSERGMASFTVFNTDTANRPTDYPGGTQAEMVGPHTHPLPRDAAGALNIQSLVDSANSDEAISAASPSGTNSGTENRVRNVGVIYVRRF